MWVGEYKHMSTKAYEHWSTQVHISLTAQFPQHSSIVVKAFEHKNVQLHDHLSLQAYIINQVCAHVCGYETCEYQCMWAWEHVIIKTCGIVAYDQKGMWAWEHVIIKACERVSIQACEHPSMWSIKQVSIQVWVWENTIFHVHMWQAKHVRTCVHKSIRACEHVIIKMSKRMNMRAHRHVGMW